MSRLLIATVGLPRSGKTDWSKKELKRLRSIGKDAVRICPDDIRLSIHGQTFNPLTENFVWAIVESMIFSSFISGEEIVILDATNITKERRRICFYPRYPANNIAKLNIAWKTEFCWVSTNKNLCVDRANKSGRQDLIPIIEAMANKFEPLDDTCQFYSGII